MGVGGRSGGVGGLLIRGWALRNFFCLQDERLFEMDANSRLGAYSNKYGIQLLKVAKFYRRLYGGGGGGGGTNLPPTKQTSVNFRISLA